jgi:hypothetical protein
VLLVSWEDVCFWLVGRMCAYACRCTVSTYVSSKQQFGCPSQQFENTLTGVGNRSTMAGSCRLV